MIETQVHYIDVREHVVSGIQPVFMLERAKLCDGKDSVVTPAYSGEFWVCGAPIFEPEAPWSITKTGQYVSVPVMAYRTLAKAEASLFGLGVQLGALAVAALRKHCREPVLEIVLVLGHQCTDLTPEGHDGYRCYLGIALKTK